MAEQPKDPDADLLAAFSEEEQKGIRASAAARVLAVRVLERARKIVEAEEAAKQAEKKAAADGAAKKKTEFRIY
jgi:hypothetical protein